MMPPSDDEIEDTTGSPDTVPVDDADTTAASDTADGNIPELDDYDDDKADDPERIARDTQLPPDSTTPDDLLPGSLTTHPGGSLGVATGSGATGAYSSGESDEGVGSDTTSAGGDA